MIRLVSLIGAFVLAFYGPATAEERPNGAKIYLTRPYRAQVPGPFFIIPRRSPPAEDGSTRARVDLNALVQATPTPLPPRRFMRVYTSSASGGPVTIPISDRRTR